MKYLFTALLVIFTSTHVYPQDNLKNAWEQFFPSGTKLKTSTQNSKLYEAQNTKGDVIGWVFRTDDIDPAIRGKRGEIGLVVAVSTNRAILGVKVIAQKEDKKWFDSIKDKFYKQFKNHSIDKSYDDIDTVSGATVSSKAMVNDVFESAKNVIPASVPAKSNAAPSQATATNEALRADVSAIAPRATAESGVAKSVFIPRTESPESSAKTDKAVVKKDDIPLPADQAQQKEPDPQPAQPPEAAPKIEEPPKPVLPEISAFNDEWKVFYPKDASLKTITANKDAYEVVDSSGKPYGCVFRTDKVDPEIKGMNGQIAILVAISAKREIYGLKVLEHREDKAYFDKLDEKFFQSFKWHSIDKPYDDIKTVEGATISSKAVIDDVFQSALKLLPTPVEKK